MPTAIVTRYDDNETCMTTLNARIIFNIETQIDTNLLLKEQNNINFIETNLLSRLKDYILEDMNSSPAMWDIKHRTLGE